MSLLFARAWCAPTPEVFISHGFEHFFAMVNGKYVLENTHISVTYDIPIGTHLLAATPILYPSSSWIVLVVDSEDVQLFIPARHFTGMTSVLLRALGLEPDGSTFYGEDDDGGTSEFYQFDPEASPPLRLDPAYRLYHVSGTFCGSSQSTAAVDIEGAFFPGPDAPSGLPKAYPRHGDTSGQHIATDFEEIRHGHVYMFLLHRSVPDIFPSLKSARTWKKNTKRRYHISEDGHLVYNAAKRARKNVVRNVCLALNPTRIIPFSNEITPVCSHSFCLPINVHVHTAVVRV
jgi:hypothetical protein